MFLFITLSFIGFATFAQEEQPCGQIPVAKPEVKAEFNGDLEAYLSGGLSEDSKTGSFTATFRMYVDCDGKVIKAKFESGDMNEADQKALLNLIYEMNFTPAQDKGRTVMSNYYITLESTNGQLKIKTY